LRRGEGVVSCIEDVVVGWLHAPCIERSDTHPPRWHPVPRARDDVPCAAYLRKASSCGCKECFRPGFHHAVEVSEDPEVTHVFRHVQAS